MGLYGKLMCLVLFFFTIQSKNFGQSKTSSDSYVDLAKSSQNPCTDSKYLQLKQDWEYGANLNDDDYEYYISFLSECKRRKPISQTRSMSNETIGCLETLLCSLFSMECW